MNIIFRIIIKCTFCRLYNWETFYKEIELWRGSSPRDIAWMDIIEILTDEQYEMSDIADAMMNIAQKLKESDS